MSPAQQKQDLELERLRLEETQSGTPAGLGHSFPPKSDIKGMLSTLVWIQEFKWSPYL